MPYNREFPDLFAKAMQALNAGKVPRKDIMLQALKSQLKAKEPVSETILQNLRLRSIPDEELLAEGLPVAEVRKLLEVPMQKKAREMTPVEKLAYKQGYLQKTAAEESNPILGLIDRIGGKAADIGMTAAIAAPAVAGLAAGGLHSKLTSPAGSATLAQKALIAAELEEALAELKRRRAVELAKETANVPGKQRSLHL